MPLPIFDDTKCNNDVCEDKFQFIYDHSQNPVKYIDVLSTIHDICYNSDLSCSGCINDSSFNDFINHLSVDLFNRNKTKINEVAGYANNYSSFDNYDEIVSNDNLRKKQETDSKFIFLNKYFYIIVKVIFIIILFIVCYFLLKNEVKFDLNFGGLFNNINDKVKDKVNNLKNKTTNFVQKVKNSSENKNNKSE